MGITVVTGAASGMGEAAVKLLHDRGSLLLCDLNAARLQAVSASLAPPAKAEMLAGDIADPGFPDRLVTALRGRPIDSLIHCAGISPTMGQPARILDVNLTATIRLIEVVRPRMTAGGAAVLFASTAAHLIGTVLDEKIAAARTPESVASLAAVAPNPGAAYSISKRGVQLLVKREAVNFGRHEARIVSVSPGVIDTPMGRAEMVQHPIMQTLIDHSPLRRAARAEEVAAVAVFLCSPAASFVTGTDVLVDGGSIAAGAGQPA